jgi:uncharacterized membrane protein (DUF2068 family)
LEDQLSTPRKRPLGITIISILMFIQAIIVVIGGLFIFLGSVVVSPIEGLLLGWVPLAEGVLILILAWGLWTLKTWAYWGTLILEILFIVLHFLELGQPHHSLFGVFASSLVDIIIVIYLLVDGNVKRAFRTGM